MTSTDHSSASDEGRCASQKGMRDIAEARLAEMLGADADVGDPEVRRLMHELSVHQIELETQNEQLRQAQISLESARARYFDLYHQAPVAYFTLDAFSRILDCNRQGGVLLGGTRGVLTRRSLNEFILPAHKTKFNSRYDHLIATGEEQFFDLEMRRVDGSSFWGHVSMNPADAALDSSAITRIAITDITDRKRMEDDAARLAAIITSSDLAIISQDVTGVVTSWNAAAERLFGFPAAEMVGCQLHVLFPPEHAAEEAETRSRVRAGEQFAYESTRVRKDGSTVSVFVALSPILDEFGHIRGVSHIARDIGEQVAARARESILIASLRESEQALKDADRRKDEFIATLSHELRNPLAPIRNAVAVLRYAERLDPKVEWCRDVIDRQVRHMAILLDDLLDVSRVTRGLIRLRRDRVELSSAIAQALEATRPLIDSRGHTLTVNLPDMPLEVEGDLTRLTQVFSNLLSNAAKYTNVGGRIELSGQIRGADVEVRVKDSGIGIDNAHLPRIFELFSQVTPSLERTQGGLGIGLSLVKGLVEKHNGTVYAQSDGVGMGSEFVVVLPLVSAPHGRMNPPAKHAAIAPTAADRDSMPQRRVLIVDDNADAAETMAIMLGVHGYETRTAFDGEQALEIAEEYRPDIIILDIGLPRMNGLDVASAVREKAWGLSVRLVACTGWGQPEDADRARKAGFDHHVVKPVEFEILLELLENTQRSSKPHAG